MKITTKASNGLLKGLLVVMLLAFSAQASAFCWWWQDCNAYKTKYPIVLVHGVSGFSSILGIDYFYGVRNALKDRGAKVYAPNITAWDDAYQRGEDLIDALDDLRAGGFYNHD